MIDVDPGYLTEGTIDAMRSVAKIHILPRFKKLAQADIRSKTHPGDLVTVADEDSERALSAILPTLLPGSCVIGEEGATADAGTLERLNGPDPVWIIDPIDGTANFVHGIARFAVMIALVQHGETLMGWIYDPILNRTLWAEKGGGAWLAEQNAAPIRVKLPRIEDVSLSTLTAGLYNKDLADLKGKFARIIRLGSAAHDYWSLTDGRMQVLTYRRLKPWDHAAGLLIHSEAGGYNRMLSGQPYSPAGLDQIGILCTPNFAIWRTIARAAPPIRNDLVLPPFR